MMADRLATLVGAHDPVQAARDLRRWLHEILADYTATHKYLDDYVPQSEEGHVLDLAERVRRLAEK